MLLNPYAIITASNVSIFIVLLISSFIILKTISETKKKKNFSYFDFIENKQLRLPVGFFLLILGLLVRITSAIPTPHILATDEYELFKHLNEFVFPAVYTVSETLIFGGFVIIFWPTILRIMFNFFGSDLPYSFYVKAAIFFVIMLKLVLTIIGLGVYSFFTL